MPVNTTLLRELSKEYPKGRKSWFETSLEPPVRGVPIARKEEEKQLLGDAAAGFGLCALHKTANGPWLKNKFIIMLTHK
jgi:hypothetical protein